MEQTNSTIENNDVASSSSHNISIPQLTDARKQEIRKKILERQRQARLQNSNRNAASSSSTASTSNTINTNTTESVASNNNNNNNTTEKSKSKETEDEKPPNQEMIKKAVTFLSSPKVQSAPTSRKHSFLLSKGCTRKEIELAEKEIEEKGLLSNNSQSSVPAAPSYSTVVTQSQTPPPLPPRTYQPQNIQIVYRNPPLTRFQKVRRGLFIILFGASIIKGISIVVKKEIMRPLRQLYLQYTKYLESRNTVLNKYMLQIIEYCALFINDKNKDKVKQVKTIEEIEKEKKMIENEKKESEVSEEKEKDNKKESGDNEGDETNEKEKKPGQRKAIKLKIHRKKEVDVEPQEGEETQLVKKDTSSVRTLSSAVQDYIDRTNDFETKCKDAIDTYTYDLERNSDLFSGSLGQTMKLSSEVYQMVSREVYYNSSASSYFYMDSYQTSGADADADGPVSLYARVNNIKSDIRRLKGMLLNHRNFPKYKQRALGNTTPIASPTLSSS